MKPYYEDGLVTLYHGDCLEVLPHLGPFDAVVTDPPYGLKFMGKAWDYSVPSVDTWQAVFAAAKPGAHLLSFAGTRTQHRMAVNIEDAGFEIRDLIAWVYGSGFPKSLDVSKALDGAAGAEREVVTAGKPVKRMIPGADQNATGSWIKDNGREFVPTVSAPATDAAKQWTGWGTALKPALEPITLARRPLIGTVAANVLEHGTGALNIDGCRVGTEGATKRGGQAEYPKNADGTEDRSGCWARTGHSIERVSAGRWPANLIHDGSEEVVGLFPQTGKSTGGKGAASGLIDNESVYGKYSGANKGGNAGGLGDSGSAARFFYCAKASKSERGKGNTHPTVKPVAFMQYLIRLVTPPGGVVLDPFGGSGTTGLAARAMGFRCVLIETDEHSCEMAAGRLHTRQRALDFHLEAL